MEKASRSIGPKEREGTAAVAARGASPETVSLPPLRSLPKCSSSSSSSRQSRGGSRKEDREASKPPPPLPRNRGRSKRPYRVLEIGATRLMHACQQGDGARVLRLLEKEPETLGYRDRALRSALHYCMEGGGVAGAAIAAAAPELVDAPDAEGHTPLHLAVIAGDARLVAVLLANGADPNAKDSEGHGLLHWATVCGEVECARLVLAAGARPSSPDLRGGSPLHYAAQCCGGCASGGGGGGSAGRLSVPKKLGLEVLRILLEYDADVEARDEDGRQPILWAASAGSVEAVLALARAGGSAAGATDKDGLTALHCAASRGHAACVEALVDLCGCDPDHVDDNGCSALHYAATLGRADATALLLKLGAEPNRRDRKGRTPALCAAAKGRLETLKILTEHGGSLEARTVRGTGLAHEAVLSGRTELLEWLAEKRPNAMDLASQDGKTPLHVAALNARLELCQLLIEQGARPNAIMRTRKNGPMTPLDAALYRGHRDCAKIIQMHGGTTARRLEPRPSDQGVSVAEGSHERETSSDETRERRRAQDPSRQRSRRLSGQREKSREYRRGASNDVAEEEMTTAGEGETFSRLRRWRRRRRRRHHRRHHRPDEDDGDDDGEPVRARSESSLCERRVRAEYKNESWSEANEYSEEEEEEEDDERSAERMPVAGKRGKEFSNTRREPSRSDDDGLEVVVVVVVVKKSLEKSVERRRWPQRPPRRRRWRRRRPRQPREITAVSDETARSPAEPKKNTQDSASSQGEAVERVTVTALVHEGQPEIFPHRASEKVPRSGVASPVQGGADNEREPELSEKPRSPEVKKMAGRSSRRATVAASPPVDEAARAPTSDSGRMTEQSPPSSSGDRAPVVTDERLQREEEEERPAASPRDASETLDDPIESSLEKIPFTEKNSLPPLEEMREDDEGRAILAVIESPRWKDDAEDGEEIPETETAAAAAAARATDPVETETIDAPRVFRVLPSTSEEEETSPRLPTKRVEKEERGEEEEEEEEEENEEEQGRRRCGETASAVRRSGIRKQRRDSAGRDSGIEPSPRVSSKIPTRTDPYRPYGGCGVSARGTGSNDRDDQQRGAPPDTVTRDVQANLRRYHLERKIFFQLMELKRLQIRHGRANERVLVKRQVESFHKAGMSGPALGVAKYDQPLTFRHFETFLYEQLRRLQRRPATPDFCSEAKQCTQKTHRCHHATSAYTSLPVYACLSAGGVGQQERQLLLPRIETRARGRMTVRVTSGGEREGEKRTTTALLPVENVDRAKRYYVTFTVRGEHEPPSSSSVVPPPPPPLLVAGKRYQQQPR